MLLSVRPCNGWSGGKVPCIKGAAPRIAMSFWIALVGPMEAYLSSNIASCGKSAERR
jgi:hypothetical protein